MQKPKKKAERFFGAGLSQIYVAQNTRALFM